MAAKNNKCLATWGESYVAKFLSNQGFSIVETNYTCKLGEVDIIARKQNSLVFVEVKTRNNSSIASSAQMINPKKQYRIVLAAKHFLATNQSLYNSNDFLIRFDCAILIKNDEEIDLKYVENAFQAI